MNSSKWTSRFDSQVDIIIPYHGQYDRVTNLIESIFKYTRSNYYALYVVDDHSPNANFIRSLQKNGRGSLTAIRCKEQRGFAGAMKAAYELSESPYVCFINSDCLIEDINWLRSMGESLLQLKSQGVRMVAPLTNNAVGGHPAQEEQDKLKRKSDVIIGPDPNDFLSLYCFMCHRELFPRCGGFLKEYPFGYFEDQEFAFRMQQKGFKQAVCGSSWVRHHGGATIKSIWRKRPNVRLVMENENHERCKQDMKALLR